MDLVDVLSTGLENVEWIGVIVATISSFIVGSIWYHEKVMGKQWMAAVPLKKKDVENANMGKIFGLSAIAIFVSAVALSVFANILEISSVFDGALLGGVIGAFFVSAATASNYLFSQRKPELFYVDASYMILTFAVMGGVIGAFLA